MSFRPGRAFATGSDLRGEIDYRLARQSIIKAFRKGRMARHEVCDAHPELMRAARNIGEESSQECPICEAANVVFVSYVFGPGMSPQGKCVTTKAELRKLRRVENELACYVVEVCPQCCWNHLVMTFVVPPIRSRLPRSARSV